MVLNVPGTERALIKWYSGGTLFFLALIFVNFGLISIPSFAGVFIIFITALPFFALFFVDSIYYSWVDIELQEDLPLVIFTTKILFVSIAIFTATLIAKAKVYKSHVRHSLDKFRIPLFLFGVLFLFCCYIAEPGPSLLAGSYTDTIKGRAKMGGTLAGVFMSITWVGLFMCYKKYQGLSTHKIKVALFWAFTIFGSVYLLLHSRRTELIGIFSILFVDLFFGKKLRAQIPSLLLGLSLGLMLFLLGSLRNAKGGITNASFKQISNAFNSASERDVGQYIVSAPAGSGNIYTTMLSAVYLVDQPFYGLQRGEIFKSYSYSLIPSDVLKILGLKRPHFFSDDLYKYSAGYHGGCFIFAPIYANFGIVGLFFFAYLLGALMAWLHKSYFESTGLKKYVTLIIVFYFIKGFWYEPIFLPKALYFTFIAYLLLTTIFKERPQSKNLLMEPSN